MFSHKKMATTPAAAEKFKPAHQIVLVVPSKSAAELKLRESLAVLKVLLAMKAKKIECDLVTLNECKFKGREDYFLTLFYINTNITIIR